MKTTRNYPRFEKGDCTYIGPMPWPEANDCINSYDFPDLVEMADEYEGPRDAYIVLDHTIQDVSIKVLLPQSSSPRRAGRKHAN